MDHSLITQLREFINKESLLEPSDRVLVAVSGGVDSMVLLHILDQLGYELGIAHVNYQLRSEQSDNDENFVHHKATEYDIPFFVKRCNTKQVAKDKGSSTQMVAREVRYRWFNELLEKHQYNKVATAHHLNDVLETLLLNITKGTGIAGFHGIPPKRGSIIRPLLFSQKEVILSYAKSAGIDWREDRSNKEVHYQRNLIRHKVIPVLKQINPSLEDSTKQTVEIIRSVEQHFRLTVGAYRQKWFCYENGDIKILKSDLNSIDAPFLYEVIRDFGFSYQQCKSLLSTLSQTGKLFYSKTHILNVDRDSIFISSRTENALEVVFDSALPGEHWVANQLWKISDYTRKEYEIESDKNIAAIDLDQLELPLKVRHWQKGDKFYPLGMAQQKKLSDFFIDNKTPRIRKDQTLVLLSNDQIVWVVGHRIDNRFKVTSNTKRVLEIRVV